MSRELDIAIATKVLGFVAKRIKPDWYPLEVTLFFAPNYPDEILYTYDANACNAMMYRNGVDEKRGTAPPLPHYSGELDAAWEVVSTLRERGQPLGPLELTAFRTSEDLAEAICEAAIRLVPETPEPKL